MSWSETKIHKGSGPHSLQNVCFADFELTDVGNSCVSGSSDGFQMTSLGQPTAALGQGGGGIEAKSRECQPLPDMNLETPRQNQRMNELLTALAEGLTELSRLREQVLKNSSDDMLRLVLAIAEQIIHREVVSDPTIILATLQEALQAAIISDAYHVKVHPDDLALVMEKKPLFLASISGLKNITLEGDASLSRGGCLVESELGQVDASIESQLGELRQKLLASEESK